MAGQALQLLSLLALVAAVLFLRPRQLGGDIAYVIVSGKSMQPTLWTGDLVLARRARSYAVGDVVAYRVADSGLVIHRIIGREGDAYTFQGDNNSFVDPWTATPEAIAGKGLVAIPRLGVLFSFLQVPSRLAGVVVAIFLYTSLMGLVLAPRWGSRERRRRRRARLAQRRRGALAWLLQ